MPRRSRVRVLRAVVLTTLALWAAACSGDSGDGGAFATGSSSAAAFDHALHDELMRMFDDDQAARSGGGSLEDDQARTDRLAAIIDEHGWPTYDLVGEDGAEAAWAIAQHSDLDPEFQKRALELLREAVAAGQGSPGDLAYLEDRLATGSGEPQTYGTQIRCGPDGPEPATPIDDPAGVDRRRADAGLDPFDVYLDEMAGICAESSR